MNWQNYHAYRAFDEFLQSVVVERRSYVTAGREVLDFPSAFADIKTRFVEAFDASDSTFDEKARDQFKGASANTKRVFANFEYLWCMPVGSISGETKREYALRWFKEAEIVSGDRFFFWGDHGVANPGMWHLTNKYLEILSICRIFQAVLDDAKVTTLAEAKKRMEALALDSIYKKVDPKADFYTRKKCSMYHLLLHLSAPDRYEAIVSSNHKERIVAVFGHVIEGENLPDRERKIQRIREKLYDAHEPAADGDRKRRWFFYLDGVKPLWIDKKTKETQRAASITVELWEEIAAELEGERQAAKGYRLTRSAKLVAAAKERDGYTCMACRFHYENAIVQAHHLDPLSERKHSGKTKVEDLITLCPNCHYLAHYLLRKSDRYKQQALLVEGLRKLMPSLRGR